MKEIELYHLGDFCEPGIIINDILNDKKKLLFMLGNYNFNDIVSYLKDNDFEKIYDRNFFQINKNRNVRHSLYKFVFNHDYKLDDINQITNYEFIVDRFNEKISNFKEMLNRDEYAIFINFTRNVNALHVHDMVDWLNGNKRNKLYKIMIFTNFEYEKISIPNVYTIKLEHSYYEWYEMERDTKLTLYTEIYGRFIDCLCQNGVEHAFPKAFSVDSINLRV